MPTSTYEDDQVERVYEEIEVLKRVKGVYNLILMRDWNGVVGKGKEESTVDKYGLSNRNEREVRLAEFCVKHMLVIVNKLFKNHKKRKM